MQQIFQANCLNFFCKITTRDCSCAFWDPHLEKDISQLEEQKLFATDYVDTECMGFMYSPARGSPAINQSYT